MKNLTAAAFVLALSAGAALGAGGASAATLHVGIGVRPPVHHRVIHHRRQVCQIRHHRRVCFWR